MPLKTFLSHFSDFSQEALISIGTLVITLAKAVIYSFWKSQLFALRINSSWRMLTTKIIHL